MPNINTWWLLKKIALIVDFWFYFFSLFLFFLVCFTHVKWGNFYNKINFTHHHEKKRSETCEIFFSDHFFSSLIEMVVRIFFYFVMTFMELFRWKKIFKMMMIYVWFSLSLSLFVHSFLAFIFFFTNNNNNQEKKPVNHCDMKLKNVIHNGSCLVFFSLFFIQF